MRIPHEIVIDQRKHKVLIDGLPFIYPLAEEGARPEFRANGIGIVWLPLICDRATFKADYQLGGVTYGETQPEKEQRPQA